MATRKRSRTVHNEGRAMECAPFASVTASRKNAGSINAPTDAGV